MGLHARKFDVYCSQWASGSADKLIPGTRYLISSDIISHYLKCFVICALWPDTIMQICVECTCIFVVTSLLVAFHVWGVGSRKLLIEYITKPQGIPPPTKRDNEQWVMDTRYLVLYKKLRHAWWPGTCAPWAICALALLRGAYWHAVCCDVYFVQRRCYTLVYTFPWNNENACVRIPADAYMPTRLVHL